MNEIPSRIILRAEDKDILQSYVDSNPAGAPYQRRSQILLLADEGHSQESIAATLSIPIIHIRQILRAYNRQGLTMFPRSVISPPLFSPDVPIDEAARIIMRDLYDTVNSYLEDLESVTTVRAVHETRKTCRRLRTALRVFSPYFEKKLLKRYRRGFKEFMQRLGNSRDIAVFLFKLDDYLDQALEGDIFDESARLAYASLRSHWEEQQVQTNVAVREFLLSDRSQKLLAKFGSFVNSVDSELVIPADVAVPIRTRHLAPLLIAEKVVDVRAFDDKISNATPVTFHRLRIAFKELRYTMEFFEQVMGPQVVQALDVVKELLLHLGDLNDARIHLEMLDAMDEADLQPAIEQYRQVKQADLERLSDDFQTLWRKFETPEWRRGYLEAVASL